MRFMMAFHRPGAQPADWWAPENEPVVPNFPTGHRNTFLSAVSFKAVPYARVADTQLDIDALARNLSARYKCLPAAMLEAYVLEIAKLAHELPLDAVCQCYMDDDGERVCIMLPETGDVRTLWDKQPIPGGAV